MSRDVEVESEDDDEGYVPEPEGDDDEEDDEVAPLTHLEDEAYDEFVQRELAGGGPARKDPPIVAILVGLTIVIILVALALA